MVKNSRQFTTRPPLERMMEIHNQLKLGAKKGVFPNCNTLRQHRQLEGYHIRTLMRDIEFMRDRLLLPIGYDKSKRGYYYTREVDEFPGTILELAELFALLLARKVVGEYYGPQYQASLDSAFDKLSKGLDTKHLEDLRHLGNTMEIRPVGMEELPEETFTTMARAMQEQRQITFQYRKHNTRNHEQRQLEPYQLVCAHLRWYAIGRDPEKDAMRAFVLSRMSGLQPLAETFVRPKEFRLADYLAGSFGVFRGDGDCGEVIIDLDSHAADAARGRRWHPSQVVTELPDGGLRLTLRLDNLEEIEPWVLSWGAHATVVSPPALAQRVTDAARAILARTPARPAHA